MLHITAKQMQLFANVMRGNFEDSAIRLLRAEYPKTTGAHSDDKLRHFVKVGIERPGRHGVAAVADVERWLRLMMQLGPTSSCSFVWTRSRSSPPVSVRCGNDRRNATL
jgi:hypothetical protein